MAVFLRVHGDVVAEQAGLGEEGGGGLVEALREWRAEQEREGRRLGALVGYCSGVVGFLRSTR